MTFKISLSFQVICLVFWLLNIKPPSESHYNFNNFEPDADCQWIEDIIVGAVNRQLEIQFGTRADFLFQWNNYFLSFLWVEFETQFETPVFITPWVIVSPSQTSIYVMCPTDHDIQQRRCSVSFRESVTLKKGFAISPSTINKFSLYNV